MGLGEYDTDLMHFSDSDAYMCLVHELRVTVERTQAEGMKEKREGGAYF